MRIIDSSKISVRRAYFAVAIVTWYAQGIFEYPWSLAFLELMIFGGLWLFSLPDAADDRAGKLLHWDADRM
jgi:hypothetical protein